jgi:hypothetical protein
MKKIAIYIFFSLYFCQTVFGQLGIEFRVWGASSGCYINSVMVDKEHNIIIAGYYHKEKSSVDTTRTLQVNGRSFVLAGSNGSFVAKLNPAKEVLWLKMTERDFRSIYSGIHVLLDNNNNIYAIGQSGKSVTGDGATAETFISNYSKDGVLLWEKTLSGITDNGELKPQRDSQGNLYLIGRYVGDLKIDGTTLISTKENKAESYLLKLSTTGRYLLSKSFPAGINLNAITINTANEFFTAGDFEGNTQLDTGFPISSTGLKDIFYAKYSATGQLEWAKTIGGQTDDECHHIKADKSGSLYLSGVVDNEARFNTVPVKITGSGRNIFLSKLNSANGQLDWVRNMPFGGMSNSSERHSLVAGLELSPTGEPYVYGVVTDFLTVNATTQLLPFFFPFYYFLKYDANGNFSFGKQYNISDGFGITYWNSIYIESNGSMQIVCTSQTTSRINGSRNDSSYLLEKNEVDACNDRTFSIEKSGNILKPVEPYAGLPTTGEQIFLEKDFGYQWYKNGEKVANATTKTLETKEAGHYTLRLLSKTSPVCIKSSTNFVSIFPPTSGLPLLLSVDSVNKKLIAAPTIDGSTLAWYRNNQLLTGQNTASITYQPDGTYQVKELYQNVTKESNEVVFNNGLIVEIKKETFNQLGDPCRPGPYLKTDFVTTGPVRYQWFLNGIAVKDSTNNHFNPVTTGVYQVSAYLPDKNITYMSGRYQLVPADFPKSLPIMKIDDVCSGNALLKVNDAFMQKYQFRSIVWRIDGQDIPNETNPYYKATKSGYYTYSVKYLVDSKPEECTYNSFIEFTKKPGTDMNLGYSYSGSGCVVDLFKIFVDYNKNYTYSWTRNDTLLKNEQTNELFIKDKGVYKAIVNKGDGCINETNAVTLKGCTDDVSNQFLMLNPPVISADKTTVFANEQSFIRTSGCTDVNFQWLKDAEPIAGANQATFEIKQSGTYRLQIDKLGCTAVSEPVKIVVENILSSEPETAIDIKVFPNPFSETLTIELPARINKKIDFELKDISGKLLKNWRVDDKYNLSLTDIPEGVYRLSFDVDNKRFVKKIIKKK